MPLLRAKPIIISFLFAIAIGATSQDRGPGNIPANSSVASTTNPANLKVLPKDISKSDLNKLMAQYSKSIGQPCAYCHAQNPETNQIDFASDDNPKKNTARIMIRMTTDLNSKYLAELGDRRYSEPFTCGNCHRGQIQPPPFE
jgi:hypothetical protein